MTNEALLAVLRLTFAQALDDGQGLIAVHLQQMGEHTKASPHFVGDPEICSNEHELGVLLFSVACDLLGLDAETCMVLATTPPTTDQADGTRRDVHTVFRALAGTKRVGNIA